MVFGDDGSVDQRRVPALAAETATVALVVAAALAVEVPAAPAVRTVLIALAAVAVIALAAPLRRRGAADAVLVGVGVALVAAVLVGFVLDLLPGGLTRLSFATGYAVLGVGTVVVAHVRRAGAPLALPTASGLAGWLRRHWPTGVAVLAAAAVTVVALTVSVRSVDATRTDPVALSVTGSGSGSTDVLVSVTAGGAAGPYRLEVASGPGPPRALGPAFRTGPDHPVTRNLGAVSTAITVTLRDTATGRPVRTVTVEPAP